MHLYPVLFICLHGYPMDSDEDNVGLHCVLWRFSSRYFYRGVDDYHKKKQNTFLKFKAILLSIGFIFNDVPDAP